MPSLKSNSSLARTQSLRVHPKSALTAPLKATAPIAKPTETKSVDVKSADTKSPEVPVCTSHVNLFLTNLRLLELDLEPDWPDITSTTLSAKDAAGGQKKRVRCVEWALYQLFSLWDHDDAETKLQPFYPPADQVQSSNLRAAFLRSLEVLKKNGIFGRDILIRKTMLDECKGERLEEVLAIFSSAVLKKLVSERALNSGTKYRPTVSESISLESWGYKGDRTELNGLLLAHKVSLRSILEKKNAARQKYRDFAELLDMKERRISRRREQAKSDAHEEGSPMSDAAKSEIRRILRNNWTGNEHWLDGALLGDGTSHKSGLLNTPFDDVWSGVKAGCITDFENQTAGLLEQLELRVRDQQTRLQKWKAFQNNKFGHVQPRLTRDPPPVAEKNDDAGFDFTAHLHLDFDASCIKFDNPPREYAKLATGLTTELEDLKSTKIPDFSSLVTSIRRGPTSITPQSVPQAESISDLSDWEDEPEVSMPLPKIRESTTSTRPTAVPGGIGGYRRPLPRINISREDGKTSLIHRENLANSLTQPGPLRIDPRPVQVEYQPYPAEDDETKASSQDEERGTPNPPLDQPQCSDTVTDTISPISPTQALADEILTSMNNASPSPVKKSRYTLSLAERTRLSMARRMSFELEDESPQISPVEASKPQEYGGHALGIGIGIDLERGEEYEDLMTRTRRSMAGFEAARQKAQLEKSRSQRNSNMVQKQDPCFPKVDEEPTGDFSIVEGLIEDGQEDYEAIFKSRPRIAFSPEPNQFGR